MSVVTLSTKCLINILFQVRAAAASRIPLVAKHLPKETILTKIIPSSQRLVTDTSEFVRALFANEVNLLAPFLGQEDTVQYVLPMLLLLLRDETSEVCMFWSVLLSRSFLLDGNTA